MSAVAAAVVLIAAGLVLVPKLTAPNVESLRAKGDVPGLLSALAYKDDPQIRANAAVALGALGAPEALIPLLSAQKDSDPAVVAAAKSAPLALLGSLPDEQAAVALIAAATSEAPPVGGSGGVAEQTLTQYLAQIGAPRALKAMLVVQSDPRLTVSADALVSALALLGTYSDTQAVTSLIELAEVDSGAWGEGAMDTLRAYLGAIGNNRALTALFIVQADQRAQVSAAAEETASALLAADTDEHVVTTLAELTKDATQDVRKRASARLTDFLVDVGVKRALKAVQAAEAGDAWLAIALRVERSQLSAETRRRNIQLDTLDSIKSKAAGVPKGKRVEGAPGYTASGGFHPVIVIRKDNPDYSWKAGAPTALRFLELVAVVSDSRKVVQVCPYESNVKVTRYRHVFTVKLYSAKNAKLITTTKLSGGTPSSCKPSVWASPGDRLEIDGSTPNIKPWLNSKVHAP
ncbi:MAG: HEAT repeat domain-containing protein [Propionicimonas sp.]